MCRNQNGGVPPLYHQATDTKGVNNCWHKAAQQYCAPFVLLIYLFFRFLFRWTVTATAVNALSRYKELGRPPRGSGRGNGALYQLYLYRIPSIYTIEYRLLHPADATDFLNFFPRSGTHTTEFCFYF